MCVIITIMLLIAGCSNQKDALTESDNQKDALTESDNKMDTMAENTAQKYWKRNQVFGTEATQPVLKEKTKGMECNPRDENVLKANLGPTFTGDEINVICREVTIYTFTRESTREDIDKFMNQYYTPIR